MEKHSPLTTAGQIYQVHSRLLIVLKQRKQHEVLFAALQFLQHMQEQKYLFVLQGLERSAEQTEVKRLRAKKGTRPRS